MESTRKSSSSALQIDVECVRWANLAPISTRRTVSYWALHKLRDGRRGSRVKSQRQQAHNRSQKQKQTETKYLIAQPLWIQCQTDTHAALELAAKISSVCCAISHRLKHQRCRSYADQSVILAAITNHPRTAHVDNCPLSEQAPLPLWWPAVATTGLCSVHHRRPWAASERWSRHSLGTKRGGAPWPRVVYYSQ